MRHIDVREGYAMRAEGVAELEAHRQEGLPVFKLRCRQASPAHSMASLTRSDMERNAQAVADGKKNSSFYKVQVWQKVHDTFAVTVVDGRVFIPDATKAAARAKKIAGRLA